MNSLQRRADISFSGTTFSDDIGQESVMLINVQEKKVSLYFAVASDKWDRLDGLRQRFQMLADQKSGQKITVKTIQESDPLSQQLETPGVVAVIFPTSDKACLEKQLSDVFKGFYDDPAAMQDRVRTVFATLEAF